MKMLCFRFHQNRPINEEFEFFEGRGRGRIFAIRSSVPTEAIEVLKRKIINQKVFINEI